jgi:hypothetical protein
MGQVLDGSASTTAAVRRAIQNSQQSLMALAKRYGINPNPVARGKRTSVTDRHTRPKAVKSMTLALEAAAIIVAFCQHTLLDC